MFIIHVIFFRAVSARANLQNGYTAMQMNVKNLCFCFPRVGAAESGQGGACLNN